MSSGRPYLPSAAGQALIGPTIGLAVAAELTTAHGGIVTAASQPGGG